MHFKLYLNSSVYHQNIFGSSSNVFGNSRKMFGNVCLAFGTILENLRKSSESGRKSSENHQKRFHEYVYIIKRTLQVSSKIWVETAQAASASTISAFWKTHKCKLIWNWTRKTVWLLINNANMIKFSRKKCRNMFLEAIFRARKKTRPVVRTSRLSLRASNFLSFLARRARTQGRRSLTKFLITILRSKGKL